MNDAKTKEPVTLDDVLELYKAIEASAVCRKSSTPPVLISRDHGDLEIHLHCFFHFDGGDTRVDRLPDGRFEIGRIEEVDPDDSESRMPFSGIALDEDGRPAVTSF